ILAATFPTRNGAGRRRWPIWSRAKLPNGRPSSRRPALRLNELIALLQHVLDYDDLLLYWEPLLDGDYLILSTIHSAKRQEWKSIFSPKCHRWLPALRSVDGYNGKDRGRATSSIRLR